MPISQETPLVALISALLGGVGAQLLRAAAGLRIKKISDEDAFRQELRQRNTDLVEQLKQKEEAAAELMERYLACREECALMRAEQVAAQKMLKRNSEKYKGENGC